MTAMTLIGFLAARLSEDESDARSLGGELRGASWQGGAGTPERVLAEVAAKRRIVERWRWAEDHPSWVSDMEVPWDDAMDTLRDLAAVYADHPEFDPAWRVAL